jgi:hypothetical protein
MGSGKINLKVCKCLQRIPKAHATIIIRTVIEKVTRRNLLAFNKNFFFFIILSNPIIDSLKDRPIEPCEFIAAKCLSSRRHAIIMPAQARVISESVFFVNRIYKFLDS